MCGSPSCPQLHGASRPRRKVVRCVILYRPSYCSWASCSETRAALGHSDSSHESTLTQDLLKLGMIAPAPIDSGLCWVFPRRGRTLLAYLLDSPGAIEEPRSAWDRGH